MVNQVIYELGLRDKMSAGIQGATGHVNALEKSLFSIKGLVAGIGVGMAAFKLSEFASQANEEWDKMEFAMSQVQAGLKSTEGAAGLTFDELKKGAEDFSHNLKFTQSEILSMQSVLLTFPSVTKEVFSDATSVITDMSTRLGTDLKGSAIQVGKALQDPVKGITALRKAGVNFSKDQQDLIKNLVATNRAAEAQALIIAELRTEFGGSALAAAEADKSFRLDKTMEENKVILGEFLDQIKEEMLPALIAVADAFKNVIVWVKENWKTIKTLTIALGSAFIAFKAMTVVPAIFLAIENAAVAAAVGTGGFGAAMTAALGPVALLAAAVGGLVLVYRDFLDDQAEHIENMKTLQSNIVKQENAAIAMSVAALEKQGLTREKAVEKAKELEMRSIQQTYDELDKRINNTIEYKEKSALIDQKNILKEQMGAALNYNVGLVPKKSSATSAGAAPSKALSEAKTKATGSKSVTINVTIQKLGETTINTTNIKEGARMLHDRVVAALTGAVNDFQVVAQNS